MSVNDPSISCISCCECCQEIPLDAALAVEGSEYVLHFCGLECYERFQARAKARIESDIDATAPDNGPHTSG
jgi:hypothetical protein